MKTITLTAEDHLVDRAQAIATARNTSLENLCIEWLKGLCGPQSAPEGLADIFLRLDYVQAGGPFSRIEMNDR